MTGWLRWACLVIAPALAVAVLVGHAVLRSAGAE